MTSVRVYVALLVGFTCAVSATRFFPSTSVWYEDVSAAALDAESDTIINALAAAGGWGTCSGSNQVACGNFQTDLSFRVLYTKPGDPTKPIVKNADYYSPDCDYPVGTLFPLPASGGIEGHSGAGAYTCDNTADDCHLIVVDQTNKKVYESYSTTVDSAGVHSTCVIIWDMCQDYPKAQGLRGDQCSSADAAGFPIAQLLFTPDEVASGTIDHAIRFILPNYKIRNKTFVHPASHATSPPNATNGVIYGQRLRLKANVDISWMGTAAQVVATALKKYGMFLSDGGNIPLTAASDEDFTNKWSTLGFTAQSLIGLNASNFEVVDGGTRIALTYDCVLNSLTPGGCTAATTPSSTSTTASTATTASGGMTTTPAGTDTKPGTATTPGTSSTPAASTKPGTTTVPGGTTKPPGSDAPLGLIAPVVLLSTLSFFVTFL